MGCVPVNRKIHDKNALESTYEFLEKDLMKGFEDFFDKCLSE